jgi:hypothetical protein
MLRGHQVAELLREEAKAMAGVVKAVIGEVEAYEDGTVGRGMGKGIFQASVLPGLAQAITRQGRLAEKRNRNIRRTEYDNRRKQGARASYRGRTF